MRKDFLGYLATEKPDVLCLQETKCQPEDVDQVWPKAYTVFWNSAHKKGYAGTAILTKIRPLEVVPHIGLPEHDQEGRVLTAEFADFFLVNHLKRAFIQSEILGSDHCPVGIETK
jgi:exodeoxyribonuclease-3